MPAVTRPGPTAGILGAAALGALVQACAAEATSVPPCSPADPAAVEAPYAAAAAASAPGPVTRPALELDAGKR
jgi:hypothetical protein